MEDPQLIEAFVRSTRACFLEFKHAVAVSAPQFGIPHRMFSLKDRRDRITWIINPEILEVSRVIVADFEGCLSIPEYEGLVPRPYSVLAQFEYLSGKRRTERLRGLSARSFLHEFDHLEGILYLDRLTSLEFFMHTDEADKIRNSKKSFREFAGRVVAQAEIRGYQSVLPKMSTPKISSSLVDKVASRF